MPLTTLIKGERVVDPLVVCKQSVLKTILLQCPEIKPEDMVVEAPFIVSENPLQT